MSNSANYANRKLTFQKAQDMRAEFVPYKVTMKMLAVKYNCSYSLVDRILRGKAYNHPTPTEQRSSGVAIHEKEILKKETSKD